MKAGICGAASRIERQFDNGIEPIIREVVRAALDEAGLSIADVDMVVTVASDTLDGMMVPLRSELAGAVGKNYLNVSSAAGHAMSAAATAIEAGDADNVLVVGWGAASKLVAHDGRSNQFDPFYMRPIGASPRVLAALQKQMLVASGDIREHDIEAFRARMTHILWGSETIDSASRAYGFCDGAAALVLKRIAYGEPGAIIADHSMASRSHNPLDESIDPAIWVKEAIAGFSRKPSQAPARGFIEASGSNTPAEMRAVAALLDAGFIGCDAASANGKGGGAMAWFGPATSLRALAELCGELLAKGPARKSDAGIFVDLAGPLGQHVTTMFLERRSPA